MSLSTSDQTRKLIFTLVAITGYAVAKLIAGAFVKLISQFTKELPEFFKKSFIQVIKHWVFIKFSTSSYKSIRVAGVVIKNFMPVKFLPEFL